MPPETTPAAAIPAVAHFVWLGDELPWVYQLAVWTAAEEGGFERVVLHHVDALSGGDTWPALLAHPKIETRRTDPAPLFDRLGDRALADRLLALYQAMPIASSKANLLRAAILQTEGGVYLDTDTLTVAPLTDLLQNTESFCGVERIVYPRGVRLSRNPLRRGAAHARSVLRDLTRRLPNGWRAFRRIEGLYPLAANNAVMGSRPGSALMERLLAEIAAVPLELLERERWAFGTMPLQRIVEDGGVPGLTVHPPAAFYPLGPEIAEHWFRPHPARLVAQVLLPESRVVHWYASTRTKPWVRRLSPEFVRDHAHDQWFSALALPAVAAMDRALDG